MQSKSISTSYATAFNAKNAYIIFSFSIRWIPQPYFTLKCDGLGHIKKYFTFSVHGAVYLIQTYKK